MISKRCCLETKIAQCCYLKSSPYNACCKKDAEIVGHKNIRLTRRCACTFLCIRIEAVQASDIPVVTMLTCLSLSQTQYTQVNFWYNPLLQKEKKYFASLLSFHNPPVSFNTKQTPLQDAGIHAFALNAYQ